MKKIENLTNDPFQQQNVVLADGSILFIQMFYRQTQLGWFFTQLRHPQLNGGIPIYGLRVCNNGNILRQFKNIINFGRSCYTDGSREPTQIQDFSSGASSLYVLSEDEVQQYEDFLRNG